MDSSARLLIIDDEIRIISSLKELLSDIGEVFFSTNAEQALPLIHETQPDLILLDVNMPGMDGFDLCTAIKRESSLKGIPVIFLTGNIAIDAEDRAFAVGAVDFVTKPFSISTVRARIKTHLALKQRNDELLLSIGRRKESDEKFRTLVEGAADAYFVLDLNGKLIEVNRMACESLGYTREELLGLTVFDINKDIDPESAKQRWKNRDAGDVAVVKGHHRRKDGSSFPVEVRSSSAFVNGQKCVIALARDITERKKNEAILKESEEKFKSLVESATDAYFVSDSRGKLLEANRLACESLGYTRNELLALNVLDIDPDFDLKEAKAFWSRIEPGQVITFERSLRHRDGSFFPVEIRTCAQPMRGGIQFISLARNITKRKKMEEELRQSREQFRIMGETIPYGVWRCNAHGAVEYVSQSFLDLLGTTIDRINLPALAHCLPPEDAVRIIEKWAHCLETGGDWDTEYRVLGPDGSYRTVLTRGKPVRDENGNIVSWVGINLDITDRKKAEEGLKLAAAVYQDSSEAMMVTDESNNIIAVNGAFYAITGYETGEVLGRNPRVLKSDHHDSLFYEQMWDQINSTGRFKGELWNKKKNGEFFAAQLTINTVTNENGLPHRYVGLMSDITEKKRSDDLIWLQANFDTLTNLPNRRYFRDKLEHEIRNAKRSNIGMALLFLDLDGFKDVNDTLGHDMGDMLLKVAADRLRDCVRETDTVARLGGDEFTVILTELHDKDNVDRIADHILHTLSQPVQLGEQIAYISASIGITLYPQDATDAEVLIRNADQAMYSAKQEGKNQYHHFTQKLQDAAIARIRLINDLRVALEKNQFVIFYQPIVELSSGVIHKAEALIRWRHPAKGLINPIDFISTAEDTGMIASFGNWVFHEAARQVAVWREKHHPAFQISVNISPVQFRKDGIDSFVWIEHLKSLGLPGEGIVVEITEGLLLDASEKVKEQLLMMRDAGIEVSLDDFGTGYSSLSFLKKFDIDYIKIDRVFVQNLTTCYEDMALCEAIIAMAHKLGLKVIAEGVETSKQHELLANSGCDYAQGYLFSRPTSANELEKLLAARPFTLQESLNI